MTFEIFHRLSLRGWRFYWRLRAKNGRIIAIAGESFHNKGDVYSIIDRMMNELDTARIEEI